MDLLWSEEDERFRAELRSWIASALPRLPPEPTREDWQARRERDTTWQRMLYDAGYAGINWPADFGGRGAALSEQLVFYEEITKAGAPDVGVNFVGLLHAGSTIIAEATDEQRARPLPAIPKGDDVRVPVANRVGAENDGWRVAMVTFSFERGTSLVSEMVEARRQLDELVKVAKGVTRGSATAWDDVGLRREIGHAAAELDALWNMVKRTVSEAARTGVPGVGASVVKLYYTELIQRIGDLALRVLDRASLSLDDVFDHSGHFVEERLRTLALTIAAGSSQIQRNIIGERILGLPR